MRQLQGMLDYKTGWARAEGPEHDIVLASRVRLARNLDSPFPHRAAGSARARVLETVFAAAKDSPLKGAAYLKMDELDGVDRGLLVERHLVSPVLAEDPALRGVVFDSREQLSLMANEEDHLRLAALLPGLSLKAAYAAADALDDSLAQRLSFSFRKDFGYLTACPTNLGTGLRASCLMHLPGLGLAGRINPLLESLPRAGLTARGLYGEGTQVVSDLFQICNLTALGRTEDEIIRALEAAVGRLAAAERRSREEIRAAQPSKLDDLIHRAAGIMTNARLLEPAEAFQHLSALRLGHALGWKLPGSLETVNELLLLVQPAHIEMLAGGENRPRAELRAELVRRRLAS